MFVRVQRPAAGAPMRGGLAAVRVVGPSTWRRRRPSTFADRNYIGRGVSGAVPWWWSNLGGPGLGSTLTLPLSGSPTISSPYGSRAPIAGVTSATNHPGIDYAVPTGTPVLAAGDGTVIFAGVQSGFGNVVQIDNGGGIVTTYGHLSSFGVSPGQTVSDGQQIALSGATGDVTGPHLHFQVNVNGVAVDPTAYLTDSGSGDPAAGGDVSAFDPISADLASYGIDLPTAYADLQAVAAAPDLSSAWDIVSNDPVLMGAGFLLAALVVYQIVS